MNSSLPRGGARRAATLPLLLLLATAFAPRTARAQPVELLAAVTDARAARLQGADLTTTDSLADVLSALRFDRGHARYSATGPIWASVVAGSPRQSIGPDDLIQRADIGLAHLQVADSLLGEGASPRTRGLVHMLRSELHNRARTGHRVLADTAEAAARADSSAWHLARAAELAPDDPLLLGVTAYRLAGQAADDDRSRTERLSLALGARAILNRLHTMPTDVLTIDAGLFGYLPYGRDWVDELIFDLTGT